MLESLLYKYSPCRIHCSLFGCFVPLEFEKNVYYQWEIFCSTKTTKFLGKKPLVHTLCKLTPLACWDCSVLLAHEHVLFTSLHSIPFNSFVHWLTPPLSQRSDTIPLHRFIHWLTPPYLLAVDVRWICAELDLLCISICLPIFLGGGSNQKDSAQSPNVS